MRRSRQAQLNLTPLLDVIFMILLCYIASVVGLGRKEAAGLAEERKGLEKEKERLDEFYAFDRARLFAAEQELAAERSERKRLEEAVEVLKADYAKLAEKAGADEEMIAELKKRFGERAVETAALLETFERHFNSYEITFYKNRLVRLTTPKKEVLERTVVDGSKIVQMIEELLPRDFDASRSVFLIRYDRNISGGWIKFDDEFYPEVRRRKWIVNEPPIAITED